MFFKPQSIYSTIHGAPGLGMLVWIISGIITITAGLTAALVATKLFGLIGGKIITVGILISVFGTLNG